MDDQTSLTESRGVLPAETTATTELATAQMAAMEEAQVRAAHAMAVAHPRNEAKARDSILQALKRPALARKAMYRKPVGGETIEGPTIRLAEAMNRLWGNMHNSALIVYEDNDKQIFKSMSRDLETNTTYATDVTVHKTVERKNPKGRQVVSSRPNAQGQTVYLVVATEDEFAAKRNSYMSKAIRNNSQRLIPEDIRDEAIAVAKQSMRGTPISEVLAQADTLAIPHAKIQAMFGTLELSPDQIVDLKAILNSIEDGDTKWADHVVIEGEETDAAPEPKASPTAGLKETLSHRKKTDKANRQAETKPGNGESTQSSLALDATESRVLDFESLEEIEQCAQLQALIPNIWGEDKAKEFPSDKLMKMTPKQRTAMFAQLSKQAHG